MQWAEPEVLRILPLGGIIRCERMLPQGEEIEKDATQVAADRATARAKITQHFLNRHWRRDELRNERFCLRFFFIGPRGGRGV